MAAAAPTTAELLALILQLQSQVATLTSGAATAGPAPANAVFADTPQSLYADDLIDYLTKWGSSIYEQGCKTLDDIRCHHDDYLDSKHINLTHKALMTSALRKYDWLRERGQWGAKSPDGEKIVAMAEGCLKTDKNLKDALNDNKKTRNKINRGNKIRQKEDETWKKIPPKDGDNKKSKEMGKYKFHWCEHHMAWCMHLPSECRPGNQHKKEQSPTIGSNSATYATAAASIANPQFQTLIASMTGLQGWVNED
jgi:hypothetical protein